MTQVLIPLGRTVTHSAARPELQESPEERRHKSRGKAVRRSLRYRATGQSRGMFLMTQTTTVTESEDPAELLGPGPDQIQAIRYSGGTLMRVRFFDGLEATVDLDKFGLDLSRLHLTTARVDAYGSAVEIRDMSGNVFDIDSSVFRSHADPKYAAELEAVIADYYAKGGGKPPRKG